jgi:RNA 3'-terminal phosphate cyclase (ATP)
LIEIDGRLGEGGGQVLRTSLALSIATGQPIRLHHIRAGRSRPGLRPQHVASVQAAAAVGAARVEGAEKGSTNLVFEPTAIVPGRHDIRVGTAGSATLVLQTVIPPLLLAETPTAIVVEGGTHNPLAPPYEFLERVYLPALERLGPSFDIRLERHGFAPAGGGRIALEIRPVETLGKLELLERGSVKKHGARVLLSNLPLHVAEREAQVVRKKLGWAERDVVIQFVTDAEGPGNVVLLEVRTEHVQQLVAGFGALGVRAEQVASRAVTALRRWMKAGVPVGEHLADQLLLPMALGGGGRFCTVDPTSHTRTQMALIPMFLGCRVEAAPLDAKTFEISVSRAPPRP